MIASLNENHQSTEPDSRRIFWSQARLDRVTIGGLKFAWMSTDCHWEWGTLERLTGRSLDVKCE